MKWHHHDEITLNHHNVRLFLVEKLFFLFQELRSTLGTGDLLLQLHFPQKNMDLQCYKKVSPTTWKVLVEADYSIFTFIVGFIHPNSEHFACERTRLKNVSSSEKSIPHEKLAS